MPPSNSSENLILRVIDATGNEHKLQALAGWRVMEIIRDHGLPIKAECGGACACATCHVYIDDDWLDKLPPLSDEELDALDSAFAVEDNSRLSCQILMQTDLNGLRVTLAPGIEL